MMTAWLVLVLQAQPLEARDRCVLVSAEVQAVPPQIELRWPADPKATDYTVFRRGLADPTWGSSLARLEGRETRHLDREVKPGVVYEYKVHKSGQNGSAFEGTGYLRAGIEIPLVDRRGKVILLVDSTQAAPLQAEIRRLERDLEGDGWRVLRHDVDPQAKPPDVKAAIKKDYESDPAAVRSLFLLGHIPVPYSGRYNPDGHADHLGAWPADSYYGDLDVEWTDQAVDFPGAARPEGKNVPGDGKFDPSQLPSEVALEVGRVDLGRMPAFGKSETELLRRYLDRDHAFRHRALAAERRALISDQFGDFRGEAFVSGSWRNFAALVGAEKIETGDWFRSLTAGSYLFAHGSGAGGWQSCAGVGTTADFAQKPVQAVFTVLFGSYFGDWDVKDGLLRAPLASDGSPLACLWSGRPHWYLQSLALGETLGYATRLTQNNRGLYQPTGAFARGVHIALMGDPTLRIHVVAPPSGLLRKPEGAGVRLSWQASPDADQGYHVYRKDGAAWTRLSGTPVAETRFLDPSPAREGAYMVRAVRLERGPGGTYLNASQALFEPEPPAPER
jgi:hypothetical protein